MRTVIRAQVQVTLNINITDTWSHDVKADQVYKQACASAKQSLRNGLAIEGLVSKRDCVTHAQLMGEPKIVAIMVEID